MNERDYHDRHYAAEAALFDTALFRRVHQRAAHDFLACTGAGPTHRVLSLGCGDGTIELLLAPHVGHIVGLDLSPVAIDRARARAARHGVRNASFLVVDPPCRSFEAFGRFDFVAAFAFLHHLHDVALMETLIAARHVLRPGGAFYSADPSRRRLVGRLKGLVRSAYDRYHSPEERELDPVAVCRLAAQAGFSRPRIGYTDYFLGPLAWLTPRIPRGLALALEAADNLALRMPLLRRYASSFRLLADAR
jgi:SAM-dependent methyltransferase